ncbi:MAG TPA: ATP-binding cassette domain-containing protein [Ilumatobacteraceae bacterium]|jgi:ABC-type lipoprotein export system ATPase subunit
MTSDALVRAKGVARTFGNGSSAVVAIHGVSCEIRAGDLVALTGPSGSGKTTLLHLLAGLDVPTTGVVDWPLLGGIDDLRPGPVAVVFQAPSLLPPLDVAENVALPLLLQGANPATARTRAMEALARLRLDSLASKLPEELSGGQAQRVAVARVLAGRPRLILADEPTGQLDHASATLVIDALINAAVELGAGLVLNTHDRAIADRFETCWSMSNGRLTNMIRAMS